MRFACGMFASGDATVARLVEAGVTMRALERPSGDDEICVSIVLVSIPEKGAECLYIPRGREVVDDCAVRKTDACMALEGAVYGAADTELEGRGCNVVPTNTMESLTKLDTNCSEELSMVKGILLDFCTVLQVWHKSDFTGHLVSIGQDMS